MLFCFSDFVDFVNEVRAELDNLKKDNSRKANIKDVCKLVDAKPSKAMMIFP